KVVLPFALLAGIGKLSTAHGADPEPHPSQAQAGRPHAAHSALPAFDATAPVSGYLVRVAYVIPTNRTAQANAIANLRNAITHYQAWYLDQMERNGFGPKTFRYETEADGVTPKINIVTVGQKDA